MGERIRLLNYFFVLIVLGVVGVKRDSIVACCLPPPFDIAGGLNISVQISAVGNVSTT
jgi:hypothetical protein